MGWIDDAIEWMDRKYWAREKVEKLYIWLISKEK